MQSLPEIGTGEDSDVIEAEVVDDYPEARVISGEPNPKSERLAELEIRRAKSMSEGQIDNGRLYAGSPMYFYCKFCGAQTDVLPENYIFSTPSRVCSECQVLIDLGWHDGKLPQFPTTDQVASRKQQEAEAERKAIARKAAAVKGAATRAANKASREKSAKQGRKK